MTIELFFSNRLEYLAEKLAGIAAEKSRRTDDPFLPLKIVVPNNNLAKWLTLAVTRRESIMMNVDFQFLETGLWEMIAALDPDPDGASMLDRTRAQLLILSVLSGLARDNPAAAPIAGYLFDSDGKKYPDYSIRLWQLSEKLGHLFQEYEYHRTDMIQDWIRRGMTGANAAGAAPDDLARCERWIYLAAAHLRDESKSFFENPVLSLMEYADHVLGGPGAHGRKNIPTRPIHFFGLSQVSAFHLALIDRLKPFYDIFIYALNPSSEFWEDVRTPGETRWMKRKNRVLRIRNTEMDDGELSGGPDHPLLSAWGKPGRESVRLLCQLTDYTFNAGFVPVGRTDTVLKQVQHDILTLGTSSSEHRLHPDRSLQIFGCPGIYREVETVYQNIIFNLEADENLNLTDIAVLVPNISVYKPVFGDVFNRMPRRISYNLIDSRADIESVYGQAMLGLLSMATGRFTRKAVFDLMLNPCFLARWHLSTDDIRVWAAWADALNIFHSYEDTDSPAENAPDSGRYTWKQGLQRLRLARIFSGNPDGGTDAGHFENRVPYSDTETGDTAMVEKFGLVITALAHAADTLRLDRASAAQWRAALKAAAENLFSIPPDYPGETVIRQHLFQALDELIFFDHLQSDSNQTPTPDHSPFLDATLIAEYIRFRLGAISGGHGDYLTHGVTIAELQPMRPIPFKIVYLMGMEEGSFPGRAETSPLDLRLKKRRIGDINLAERNRYLFLETLLAVRDKFYISYISRDLQKDRELPPCNVVNQLRRFIEDRVLPAKTSFQVTCIPLKGSSPRYLEPDAVTAGSDVMVNNDLVDRVACYRATGRWTDVKSKLEESEYQRVAALNPDLSVPAGIIADTGMDEPVQLSRLKRFLIAPINESVLRHLGIAKDVAAPEDRVQVEDEPFFSEYPFDWQLVHLPLYQWLDTRIDRPGIADPHRLLDQIFDHFYADFHRRSITPAGLFAAVDKASIKEKLFEFEKVISPLADRMVSAGEAWAATVIGTPGEAADMAGLTRVLRFDPIDIRAPIDRGDRPEPGPVRLNGLIRWCWHEKETGWHVLVPAGGGPLNRKPNKYMLAPILFYLCARASTQAQGGIGKSSLIIHMVGTKAASEFIFEVDPETAENYLTDLVAEYLDRHLRVWLPFETVIQCSVNPLAQDPAAIDDTLRRQFRDDMRDAFAETADEFDRLVQPAFPADLLDRAVGRFGIFGRYRPVTGG
ncbi:MAG: hypothetical protein DSY89_06000 [Deltaproteobacteria bacterium]|nr:MAG: hypothetical protein DSY89_06000 [Deltaproteobacteria bacterium]